MTKLEYTVRFLTPAFLGNAEQSGQWRTPLARVSNNNSGFKRNTA